MAIRVTCPGCMSRFDVHEKYAGKKGPCPKCKKEITIPSVEEKVVIHAPEDAAPKDSKGVSVLKPITREEFKVSKLTWILCGIGVAIVLAVAIGFRVSGNVPDTPILALGAIALAPPIVMLGYTFFRDDDLEGFEGQEYWIRTAICSALFAATWLLYVGLAYYFEHDSLAEVSATTMGIYIAAMVGLGIAVSLATFELEVFQASLHYLVYFAACFILAMIVGVELAEPLASPKTPTRAAAPATAAGPTAGTTP